MQDKENDLYELYYDAMEALGVGDIKSAKEMLHKILIQDIDFIDAYNGLVFVHEDEGDREKAKESANVAYKKVEKIFSKWPDEMVWAEMGNRKYLRAICNRAVYFHEDGDIEKAENLYRLLLKINPSDNQGVRYLLSALLAKEKPGIVEVPMGEGDESPERKALENLLETQNKKHKFWKEK